MVGFQMDIVSAAQGFLAMSIHISAKMVLVGRLVGREARVAVEAICGVLDRHRCHLRVEVGNSTDGLRHALFKLAACLVVVGSMLLEPSTIVVSHHSPQERKDFMTIHYFRSCYCPTKLQQIIQISKVFFLKFQIFPAFFQISAIIKEKVVFLAPSLRD